MPPYGVCAGITRLPHPTGTSAAFNLCLLPQFHRHLPGVGLVSRPGRQPDRDSDIVGIDHVDGGLRIGRNRG